jgi:hypothetical protein
MDEEEGIPPNDKNEFLHSQGFEAKHAEER